MRWARTWRCDPVARALADRHYSRKRPGTPDFSGPGRNLTLRTVDGDAVWVSLLIRAEYVKHEWPNSWYCQIFRNEDREKYLSSELIEEAVAATVAEWGEPPADGFITFVDAKKTRRKRDPGRCFRRAGWREVGVTSDRGLVVLQLSPADFPTPIAPLAFQLELEAA
jgi:hypothetical protein